MDRLRDWKDRDKIRKDRNRKTLWELVNQQVIQLLSFHSIVSPGAALVLWNISKQMVSWFKKKKKCSEHVTPQFPSRSLNAHEYIKDSEKYCGKETGFILFISKYWLIHNTDQYHLENSPIIVILELGNKNTHKLRMNLGVFMNHDKTDGKKSGTNI